MKKIFLYLLSLLVLPDLAAQVVSPFNRRIVNDSANDYSFIVSGHFHGSSANQSGFPASTLLANIDHLNSTNASFLVCTGDLYMDVNEITVAHYKESLFDKLQMPLFNAVGNHDVGNGNYYSKIYGRSFSCFVVTSELFILLDTEADDGSISGEQLVFLKASIGEASKNGKIKNVFVFSHRPVWAENNKRYKDLFAENTHTLVGTNNFEGVVKPMLAKLAMTKNVLWISGSLGVGPASFFYDKDPETNITFMQTAIRDVERDAALLVIVKSGAINFEGLSLSRQPLQAIEAYDMLFWKKQAPDDGFKFRLLPYVIMLMLLHWYFWAGFSTALLLSIIFRWLYKRWKRRK